MSTSAAMPHVLQPNYVCVVVNGKPHQASKGQPTFKKLHQALERRQWSRIPKLVTLSAQLAEQSHGKVAITADGVFYKGQKVDNTLSAKIQELIEHGKSVAGWLRFMDNLYQQPDMATVNEIYEWLNSGRFALTDDGCFLAYKKVGRDYKDIYTRTFNNRPGCPPVVMPRSAVNPDRRNTCSQGLHFCSRSYLPHYGGGWERGKCRIMEVKINPADVVAIPIDYNYSKGRTWRYEVIREVQPDEMIEGRTDTMVMMQPIVEVAAERYALIKQVKALPTVKRLLKRGVMTEASFTKASTERLTGWLRKFSRLDIAPAKSKLFDNPLRFAREAAGLTLGQVRAASGMELKDVYNVERSLHPTQEDIDKVLTAIAKAQGVTYPEVPAYASSSYSSNFDDDWDDEEDDF